MDQLRIYRLNLQEYPFFNNTSQGIALFDLFGTFIIAFLLEKYLLNYLNISRKIYYTSLIPLGIITHLLIGQNTFLNSKLFNYDFNIYKIVIFSLIFYIIYN